MPSVASATDGAAPNKPAKLFGRGMSPRSAKAETTRPPRKKRIRYSLMALAAAAGGCGARHPSGFFLRHLLALLAGLRQTDGDGLLAALHLAALAAATALGGALLVAPHLVLHVAA